MTTHEDDEAIRKALPPSDDLVDCGFWHQIEAYTVTAVKAALERAEKWSANDVCLVLKRALDDGWTQQRREDAEAALSHSPFPRGFDHFTMTPATPESITQPEPAHTDHPIRHFDRTCPACRADDSDEFARGREKGRIQEAALWELARSSEEIEPAQAQETPPLSDALVELDSAWNAMEDDGVGANRVDRAIEAVHLAAQSHPAPPIPTGIDPMQDPMRPALFMNYATDETPAEMVLRKLACWLGVGGYNAPTVDADLFHRKIIAGIEALRAPEAPAGDKR